MQRISPRELSLLYFAGEALPLPREFQNLIPYNMIWLNFSDLSGKTKVRLIRKPIKDVKQKLGEDIGKYVNEHYSCFETMIEEEALRNLYSYTFVFKI